MFSFDKVADIDAREMCLNTQDSETCPQTVYSYDAAVELCGHGRYNRLCLLACSVISNAFAIDMFGFAIVVAAAKCDLNLGITETGLLASAPFASILFAFPWGIFADTRGRRLALLVSTSVGSTMSILSSFSPNWAVMFTFKLIGSSFSAAAFTLCMTFLGECTDNNNRSKYMSIMNSFNLASEIVEFGLAFLILPLSFNLPITSNITFRPWRLLALVMGLPLGIGALLLIPLCESPKFLANKGEQEKALTVLRKMYRINGGREEDYPVKMLSCNDEELLKPDNICSTLAKQTVPIFRRPLLWRTLQMFYLMTVCCSTNNVFAMWFPKMINSYFVSSAEGGNYDDTFCQKIISNITMNIDEQICNDTISTNTVYSGMIYGFIFMVLNLLITLVSAWRRISLISIFAVSAASGILINNVTYPIVNITAFTLLQGTALGIGIIASYFVDLYSTTHRGLVTCLGMMVARFGSFSGVNFVGAMIIDYCEVNFYFWSIFVISGILVALFLPSDSEMRKKQTNC